MISTVVGDSSFFADFASTITLEKTILSSTPVSHPTSAVSAAVNRIPDFKMENLL